MDNTDVEEDANWPDSLPDHIIESPVQDLLGQVVDYSQNVLGDLFIERGSYVVINGPTGVGKSVLSVQIGVEAALGRETFGIKVARPVKVLIVQAEDSRNDRIGQFQTILNRLSPDDRQLVLQNLRIVTPRQRALRGKKLFDFLREMFRDSIIDLVIFNPVFAFLDGQPNDSNAVGEFLREHLQEFLREKGAAGIVVHHTPKPPKSGKTRPTGSAEYASHGSAEWANAPRASITIERTLVSYVYEFTIGKRGRRSGWLMNQEGFFTRYFTHSRVKGEMVWLPATEKDINAARTGISSEDFSQVFRRDVDLTFEVIRSRFRAHGYNYTDEEIAGVLDRLVEKGKLNVVEADGETVYRTVKSAKKAAQIHSRMEEVFALVREAGDTGMITSELRDRVSFGNSLLAQCLEELLASGRIRVQSEGSNTRRYFVSESSLVVV